MEAVVLDVNVPIVANGQHDRAELLCIRACIRALRESRGQVVLVDAGQRILAKYRDYLSGSGQPGPGDAWFKWLWQNQANRRRCRQVQVKSIGGSDTDFEEYPADPDLAKFDPADRVFVAVAVASGLDANILNATDTDWWPVRQAFERNDVKIVFLCEELMTGKD